MVYYIGETIFFGVILMIRELKPSHKYSSVITALSVLSLAFYFLYGLIGELSLPMASAFLATLFIFENPNKRIFSFLIPVIGIASNLAIHGIYMLVSLEIVVVALIIALCYRYSETKNICAVYLTVIIAVFILVSFYIGGARSCESFDFQIVADYYSGLYTELKSSLASMIASIKGTGRDGAATSIMTEQQAKDMIEQYSKLTVAYIGAFSFLLAGIALKIFNYSVLKISKHGIRKTFAYFFPKSWVAYLYVVLSIISAFISLNGVFAIGIITVSEILMFVFAYLGIRYVLTIARASERRGFLMSILIFGFIFMTSVAVQIISYFGAWIVVSTNLIKPKA